ncbi:zinc-binding alcohol dehydrogenase family protein (plasmid) [Pseudomonas silvicola]|nr:zinc-binding alcohol dehydrogenase family protein [Pseudomonas silvicola]
MKAVTYPQPGGPEVLQLVDVVEPSITQDELLVAVEAISVEGGDIISRNSQHLQAGESLGYAAAGTILAIGSNVTGFKIGQKVATFNWRGAYAERRAVAAYNCFLFQMAWMRALLPPFRWGQAPLHGRFI